MKVSLVRNHQEESRVHATRIKRKEVTHEVHIPLYPRHQLSSRSVQLAVVVVMPVMQKKNVRKRKENQKYQTAKVHATHKGRNRNYVSRKRTTSWVSTKLMVQLQTWAPRMIMTVLIVAKKQRRLVLRQERSGFQKIRIQLKAKTTCHPQIRTQIEMQVFQRLE